MGFRVLGIPVKIEPVFFVITGLFALSRIGQPWFLASWIAVVLASILLHELGHALAFRALGYRPSIQLHAMGGDTRAAAALTPIQDIVVSLSGPAFGLALGSLVWAIGALFPAVYTTPFLGTIVSDLLWVNIGWGLINLLPILPLDGGRVLLASLRRTDPYHATSRASRISMYAAGIAGAVALFNGMVYAAAMAAFFAFDNYRRHRV